MIMVNNYDLDVKNALNDFPENETDCYIYIRGERNDDKVTTCIHSSGYGHTLACSFLSAMDSDRGIAVVMLAACTEYLSRDKELRDETIRMLKSM